MSDTVRVLQYGHTYVHSFVHSRNSPIHLLCSDSYSYSEKGFEFERSTLNIFPVARGVSLTLPPFLSFPPFLYFHLPFLFFHVSYPIFLYSWGSPSSFNPKYFFFLNLFMNCSWTSSKEVQEFGNIQIFTTNLNMFMNSSWTSRIIHEQFMNSDSPEDPCGAHIVNRLDFNNTVA